MNVAFDEYHIRWLFDVNLGEIDAMDRCVRELFFCED